MLIVLVSGSTQVSAADAAAPVETDAEFIEFLGEWQTDDGEWVDPDQLDTAAYAQAVNELEQAPVENQYEK